MQDYAAIFVWFSIGVYYKDILKKRTMHVRDWGLAYSQLAIFSEDRFAAGVGSLLRTQLAEFLSMFVLHF